MPPRVGLPWRIAPQCRRKQGTLPGCQRPGGVDAGSVASGLRRLRGTAGSNVLHGFGRRRGWSGLSGHAGPGLGLRSKGFLDSALAAEGRLDLLQGSLGGEGLKHGGQAAAAVLQAAGEGVEAGVQGLAPFAGVGQGAEHGGKPVVDLAGRGGYGLHPLVLAGQHPQGGGHAQGRQQGRGRDKVDALALGLVVEAWGRL